MKKINDDIKLYFVDLDGTALDDKKDFAHFPSIENLEAIKKARLAGKDVIISTGRLGQNVKAIYKAIGGRYLIQANGALITDPKGNIIFESRLSIKQTQHLLKIFKKYKLAIKFDDQLVSYGVKRILAKIVARKIGWSTRNNYAYPMHKEYYKIVCYGFFRKAKITKIIKEIIATVPKLSVVSSSQGRGIEITTENATKGLAAVKVAALLGIPKNATAHVGDTMNDSTAHDKVGQLIVMKNGDKKLKAMSPYCGPHYKNGGLAKVLNGEYTKI